MAKVRVTKKLNLFQAADRQLYRVAVKYIQTDINPFAVKYLRNLLLKKKQASGKSMPEKAASTIKQYKKKGWDTKRFLIRKNESAQVVTQKIKAGVRLKPANQRIIGYHDESGFKRKELAISTSKGIPRKQAKSSARQKVPIKRVSWFRLNFGIRMAIIRKLNDRLAREARFV